MKALVFIAALPLIFAAAVASQHAAQAGVQQPNVQEIVSRSVANNQADWKAAPGFTFTERDVSTKGGQTTTHTYRVWMIDGSPYNEPIAINGHPLSDQAKAAAAEKMRREERRRRSESAAARAKRIADYERGRKQDHELMQQMIAGFSFHLEGMETRDGRNCYKIAASPNPAYVPINRDTEVLKGMRGTLWIDAQAYQWVRVQAGVFKPVAFGLFVAHVEPGTQFILEEAPVEGNIWEPSYFEQRVNAKILFFGYRTTEQENYSDYKRSETLTSRK